MSKSTLSIIKPLAVKDNLIGSINSRIEKAGFEIIAQKMVHMSKEQAQEFYAIHSDKPFFNDLISNITSGPVVVQILQSKKFSDVVLAYRDLMGATDPSKAAAGTLRNDYGLNIDHNGTHGSDSDENAQKEISIFFSAEEIFMR